MKYLWTDFNLIKSNVTLSEKAPVLLDHDGTLTPVADRPEEALFIFGAKGTLGIVPINGPQIRFRS